MFALLNDLSSYYHLDFIYALTGKITEMTMLSDFQLLRPEVFSLQGALNIGFYFTVYSFFGWLLENTYSLITRGVFFKDGFWWGPFKPMYGFAPVLLILFMTNEMSVLLVLLLCFFIPTVVEYVSGALLQRFFRKQWWDYSDHHLQLHGHICLGFSLCWIALSLVCLKLLHPSIEMMYGVVEQWWIPVFPIVCGYFLVEFFMAIRRHRIPHLYIVKHPST